MEDYEDNDFDLINEIENDIHFEEDEDNIE